MTKSQAELIKIAKKHKSIHRYMSTNNAPVCSYYTSNSELPTVWEYEGNFSLSAIPSKRWDE